MLFAFASAMIVRRRGFVSASPPPLRAATVSSLMMRVKTLPRLASAAPFLCLIVCHFEWPDIAETPVIAVKRGQRILSQGLGFAGRVPRVSFSLCGSGSRLRALRRNKPPEYGEPLEPVERGGTDSDRLLGFSREYHPGISTGIPRPPLIVAEDRVDDEAGLLEPAGHL